MHLIVQLLYFQYPGVNIIGRLPGRYTGTRDDKMVLIGSHYDTVRTSPGVDDNGSGMTALLQVLKLITSPGNNIIFDSFYFFACDVGYKTSSRKQIVFPRLRTYKVVCVETSGPYSRNLSRFP